MAAGNFGYRIQLGQPRRNGRVGPSAQRHDRPAFKPFATISIARCNCAPSKSSAASSWPASAFWRPAWRTRSTTRWPRSPCAPSRWKAGWRKSPRATASNRSWSRRYLRMIQTEAFRCKEITEKLLDFSRLGDVQHQATDLCELIARRDRHGPPFGQVSAKADSLSPGEPVVAQVNRPGDQASRAQHDHQRPGCRRAGRNADDRSADAGPSSPK